MTKGSAPWNGAHYLFVRRASGVFDIIYTGGTDAGAWPTYVATCESKETAEQVCIAMEAEHDRS